MVNQGLKLICLTLVVMSHKHKSETKQSLFKLYELFLLICSTDHLQQVGTPAQCVGMRIWWKLALALLACTHACNGTTLAVKTGRDVWIPLYTEGREAFIFARDAITSLPHIEETTVLPTVSPFLFWKCPISQYSHLHTVVMHWFYFLSPLILHTRLQE